MGASLSSEGRTRLQAAVEEKNHQKVLKVLADAPGLASKPLRYRGRDRPLHIAVRRGFTGAVVALVEAAKNNPSDRDPLDMEQRLHKLLDARSEKGETALMLACAYGHPDVVSYLLKSGADPTLPDTGLRTCMHHAVMGQSPECIEELLKHKVTALPRKAVVHHRASTEGGVLLRDLCMMGYRGRPSRFIDLGALLNITPLHLATALGDVASMKVLLDHGATQLPVCRGVLIDPQVGLPLWRANSTALHIAVGNRDLQAVGLLLREYVYGSEVPLLSGFDVRMLRDAVARTAGDLAAEVMPDHAELQQVLNPRTALEEIDRVDLLGMLGPRGAPSLQKLAAAAHRQNLLCDVFSLHSLTGRHCTLPGPKSYGLPRPY
eukprot:jgi/Astpho2/6965/fgenesh1_pg.00107_%23_34_t